MGKARKITGLFCKTREGSPDKGFFEPISGKNEPI